MSFASEYSELRKKRLEENLKGASLQKETNSAQIGDIAPIANTESTEKDNTWLQGGTLEDGYQFGDLTKGALGTIGDVAVSAAGGAMGLLEGATDLILHGTSGLLKLFGKNNGEGLDWLAEEAKALANHNTTEWLLGNIDRSSSFLGEKGRGVAEGVGQVAALIGTGGLASGTAGATALTTGTMFASSMGSGMSEAYNAGATDQEALAYGFLKGGVDAGSELIFSGLGKTIKAVGFSKGLSSADDMFARKLSSKISNQFAKNIVEFGVKASAEGLEEMLAGIGTATAKKLTYMSEEEWRQLVEDEQILDQFVIGAVTSGIVQSGYVPGMSEGSLKEANKSGRDFISGLTQNETKVVEAEVKKRIEAEEADGKQLNKRDKTKIYDEVLEDIKKGYVSTDTIEKVLGGDSYKSYRDTIDSEDAAIKEFEGMYEGEELRAAIRDILDNSKRGELKTKLGEGVLGQALKNKDNYLANSYAEVAKRGQAFKADLDSYTNEYAKQTIKNIMESGVANNSGRMHDFANNVLAKISADKGIVFSVTDAKKLAETSFAVEGKTVNGYVTKDGITINIESPKYLNTVVGHEITHVLEGTEFYDALQEAVFEYAEAKGEYKERLYNTRQLYKDVEGYAGVEGFKKIKKEVAADLVGDYLFSDPNFIANLSAKNRNLFEKIFDEIKYLYKIATAGSKEKRQLERVKKAFEDAYRADSKVSGDTKYSITDKKSLDKYSQKQYNDFGWARDTGAISKNELDDLHSKAQEKGSFKKFTQTSDGEAIVEVNDDPHATLKVNNVFAFVKGAKDDFEITRVVRVNFYDEASVDVFRKDIYERTDNRSLETYARVMGEEAIRYYDRSSSADYRAYTDRTRSQQSGSGSEGNTPAYRNRNQRVWTFEETQSDEIESNNKASSKDGVFFDGKKTKYSLSDSDGETPRRHGRYNVSSEDVKLQIGPVREDIATAETPTPVAPIAEDVAPMVQNEPVEVVEAVETQTAAEPVKEEKTAKIIDTEPMNVSKKSSVWSWFMRNFVDKKHVFEDLSLETGNRELQAKANQMLYAEPMAQHMIGEGIKTKNGKKGVSALNTIRDKVQSSGLENDFENYMYHMHNIDRMTLDTRFGTENKAVFGDSVTADVSRQKAAEYEQKHPEFKEWAQEVYDYNTYLRQKLVENGIISQETAELWQEMYPHYVPIRRDGDFGSSVNVPLDSRKTGVNAPVKRAVGGNSDILNLFNTMAMRTEQTFRAITKNNFGVELMNTLGTQVGDQSADVDEILDSFDKHEELLQKGKNGMNPTLTVFEDGKRVTFEISEDMYRALKPKSDELVAAENTKLSKGLKKASNIRRGIITEYNPVFWATNAIKDAQDILINSQHAAKTYAKIPEAVRELWRNARGKETKWFTEYLQNGGEQNTYFDGQSHAFNADDTGIKKIIGIPLRAIQTLNNFVERAPRLAEYIASRESGASIETAMLDASRVTTNFAAGGDITKFANRHGFTFLNASVQGAMQQVRNIREAKANGLKGWVQLATKCAIAGLPALILNNLVWEDDEEYEELSDYVKDNYYIVAKYGDGQFVRIPKGRTVAVIQDALEQISNAATGNDEVDLRNFLELAISNLAPNNPLDNNIFAPIVQAVNNKTWYGEDLVPTRLQDLPAAEQYDESTDAISKWLGEKLNVSPYKLNYLLDQYSGGVGDVFLPMITPEVERGEKSVLAPVKDKFTTDSTMNNQNVSDFYDTMDELTSNAKSSKATDEDVIKYRYMNSINSELGDLYAKKREIQNSGLSDAEKYKAVREVQKQIVALAKESLGAYQNVQLDGSYAAVGDRHYHKNENGEWQKITDSQLADQNKMTGALNVSPAKYWDIKVGLADIEADKDANGKTISDSRKKKVVKYVNSLDIDYGAKLILYKREYKSDDRYNYEIVDYLNSRDDISYEEMATILKELGFNVDSSGNITWD